MVYRGIENVGKFWNLNKTTWFEKFNRYLSTSKQNNFVLSHFTGISGLFIMRDPAFSSKQRVNKFCLMLPKIFCTWIRGRDLMKCDSQIRKNSTVTWKCNASLILKTNRQREWKDFGIQSFVEYYHLHVQSDALLLAVSRDIWTWFCLLSLRTSINIASMSQ